MCVKVGIGDAVIGEDVPEAGVVLRRVLILDVVDTGVVLRWVLRILEVVVNKGRTGVDGIPVVDASVDELVLGLDVLGTSVELTVDITCDVLCTVVVFLAVDLWSVVKAGNVVVLRIIVVARGPADVLSDVSGLLEEDGDVKAVLRGVLDALDPVATVDPLVVGDFMAGEPLRSVIGAIFV